MALLCNGARLMTNTCRAFSGVTSNAGGGIMALRGNFDRTGAHRNFQSGEHSISGVTNKAGWPNGYVHKSWLLPQKTGNIAAVNAGTFSLAPASLNMAAGVNIDGEGTITLTVPSASLELIVSGIAAATFTMSTDGTMRADGELAGDILPYTELSPESLATAVWAEILSTGYSANQIMDLLSAFAAGQTNIVDLGGGNATVTFRDINNTKNTIVADAEGSERVGVTLDL